MKIGEYKQMMSNLTRPGTPEQNKKAEENNKKYLADRKAKTLKEYGLDKPLIVNNGNIQTEKQFTKELPIEELRRIELKGGGSVVDLDKYRKDKQTPKVKKLDLSSVLGADTPVSSLSEKDKDTVLMLLKMSGIGKED